ncbi:MAG: hypothetical protein ACFFCQ_18000 [Promethearchaeota archaeon]
MKPPIGQQPNILQILTLFSELDRLLDPPLSHTRLDDLPQRFPASSNRDFHQKNHPFFPESADYSQPEQIFSFGKTDRSVTKFHMIDHDVLYK